MTLKNIGGHMELDMEEYLAIPDAAIEIKVVPGTLYQAIRRDNLKTERKFGRIVVKRSVLYEWRDNVALHQRGNPNFKQTT